MEKVKKVLQKVGGWIVIGLMAVIGIFLNSKLKKSQNERKSDLKDDLKETEEKIEQADEEIEQAEKNLKEEREKTNEIIEEGVELDEEIDSDDADRIIRDFINS